MRISDWSSDVCSSDLRGRGRERQHRRAAVPGNSRIAHLRGSERGPEGRYRSRHNRRSKGVTMKILQPAGWSRPKGYSNAIEARGRTRSEEHTSELQSLMRISYAVFCLKKKKKKQ